MRFLRGFKHSASISFEYFSIMTSTRKHPFLLSYDWQISNFGDILNKYLFSYLLESYKLVNYENANIIGAGSIIQYNQKHIRDRVTFFSRKQPVNVWGSGLILDPIVPIVLKKRLNIYAVRGKLTANILRKCRYSDFYSNAYGDPGLLLPDILNVNSNLSSTEKIGLIFHYSHKYQYHFYKDNPDFQVIDVQKDPFEIVQLINSCSIIASTSLHGVILAHSLNKPVVYAETYPNLVGKNFKFSDYFTAYDIDIVNIPRIYLRADGPHKVSYFLDHTHRIPFKSILKVKNNLLNSFPFASLSRNLLTLKSKINKQIEH